MTFPRLCEHSFQTLITSKHSWREHIAVKSTHDWLKQWIFDISSIHLKISATSSIICNHNFITTLLLLLSLHASVSPTLTFSLSLLLNVFAESSQGGIRCLCSLISTMVHILSQRSPRQCEREKRQCTAPTCLLTPRCHWVPTQHRDTSPTWVKGYSLCAGV